MSWLKTLTVLAVLMALTHPAFAAHVEKRQLTLWTSGPPSFLQSYHMVNHYRVSLQRLSRKMAHVGDFNYSEYEGSLKDYREAENEVMSLVRKGQGDFSSTEMDSLERQLKKATARLTRAYGAVLKTVP